MRFWTGILRISWCDDRPHPGLPGNEKHALRLGKYQRRDCSAAPIKAQPIMTGLLWPPRQSPVRDWDRWRLQLRPAVVAVNAGRIVVQIAAGMDEFLAGGRELVEFGTRTLRENGVAGVAVVGLDGEFLCPRSCAGRRGSGNSRARSCGRRCRDSSPSSPSFPGRNCPHKSAATRRGGGLDARVVRDISRRAPAAMRVGRFVVGFVGPGQDKHRRWS